MKTNVCLFLITIFSLTNFTISQTNLLSYDLSFNLYQTSNSNSPIYSLRQDNLRTSLLYEIKQDNYISMTISMTSKFRKSKLSLNELFKENYHFIELISSYKYNLFGLENHHVRHGFGFVIGKRVPNYYVDASIDTKFFQSTVFTYNTGSLKSETYTNIYGFLETGYDFYLYKGLHASLTGRATLLSYTLNYDYEGEPLNPNPKKLGLNYMLFYGLGYTFGKN